MTHRHTWAQHETTAREWHESVDIGSVASSTASADGMAAPTTIKPLRGRRLPPQHPLVGRRRRQRPERLKHEMNGGFLHGIPPVGRRRQQRSHNHAAARVHTRYQKPKPGGEAESAKKVSRPTFACLTVFGHYLGSQRVAPRRNLQRILDAANERAAQHTALWQSMPG